MPPYRLVSRTKAGEVVYTCADPGTCKRLCVGGSKECRPGYVIYTHGHFHHIAGVVALDAACQLASGVLRALAGVDAARLHTVGCRPRK
jgi:L-ascorbate metabolism protein UlaG (beta-lactamase superfamily)